MTTTRTRNLAPVSRPIVLGAQAFAVLWEKLGLGDLPRPLFLPSPGATASWRLYVERAAATELCGRGIGGGGRLDHELETTLRLLARPAAEYYGWVVPPGGDALGVVVAAGGPLAVLAALADGYVMLRPVDPSAPAHALAAQLPPTPQAHGAGWTAPLAAARRRGLVDPPRPGRGQLFVAARDRFGRRRVAPPVGYADTAEGRWLFHRLTGGDMVTALPGSREAIAATLCQAHRQLTDGNRDRDR